MSALEPTLEWPRFCYSTASLFDETNKNENKNILKGGAIPDQKKNRRKTNATANKRKLQQKQQESKTEERNVVSDSESTVSAEDEQLVPVGPTSGQHQSKTVFENQCNPVFESPEKFAFSTLMRQMAQKYQGKNEAEERQSPIHQIPQIQPQVNSPNSFPSFPLDPLVLRAAFNSYFPFQLPNQPNLPTQPHPMASLFPPMSSLSSSQALTALASKKRAAYEEHFSEAKRQRFEDPLDLSSNNADSDDIVDVLSVDPPNHFSRSDPERWNVDQVALFVANIESCQEYAEIFREHSIDGSALLELTEQHLTGILNMKLGPAIRLRNSIRDLQNLTRSALSSPTSSSNYSNC